tara:strand:+ start:674 stop:1342 length:669 start_codon:yes stop_codon:yes gene_type:complete
MSSSKAKVMNHRVGPDSSLFRGDEEVPVHVGVPLGTSGIPVSDYWKSIGLYVGIWAILGWIVVAGAAKDRVLRDLGPALWGFGSGLVLAALEFVVSVKSSLLLGMEDRAVEFYPDHAKDVAEPMRGPFEALARRADIIATTCFNVAACVITWAVYITTSAIGGGARQLQWNILAFTVALLAGGTATATGNVPAFERSLFARQRALIFAISLAVAAVMHAKRG